VAHEYTFSDVSAPVQQVVLGLPLRDFSLGHRQIFLRQRNPLAFLSDVEYNELSKEGQIHWLIESVTICNQTYAYRKQLEQNPTRFMLWRQRRDSAKWRRIRTYLQNEYKRETGAPDLIGYWANELAAFRNYYNSHRVVTELKARRDPFPFLPCQPATDAKGRSLGAPYDATLIQFLIRAGLCRDEATALEYPFAKAEVHYLTHLEREGALRIMNPDEVQFEADADANDLAEAHKAGFKTVKEHTDFVYAQAMKEKASEEARKKHETVIPTGLASAIPPELKGTP
jgi:hypothetical protein